MDDAYLQSLYLQNIAIAVTGTIVILFLMSFAGFIELMNWYDNRKVKSRARHRK